MHSILEPDLVFAFVSAPIDTPTLSPHPILSLARSLQGNSIGAEGATALAAILNKTKITELKCAAAWKCLLSCQRPLTHLRTLPPFLARSYLRQLVSTPSALLPARLPHSHPRDADLVRRVLLPSGRTSRAPIYPPHPRATCPSQLGVQLPRRPGQTGRQRRRGQQRQHLLLARRATDRLAHP